MLEVHNFQYGLVTPVLAYAMSCQGSFLGLRSVARAREHTGRSRVGWLAIGAVSIGVLGIWVMHFIAMLGFAIPSETIRYSIPVTLASMVIAVAFVFGGLAITSYGRRRKLRLALAGIVTGLGVAAMHYTGMAAMRMPAGVSYSPVLFTLSVVVAIVAATAALWAAQTLRGPAAALAATPIMAAAVSGMHYTGMAAMRVWTPSAPAGLVMNGASAFDFLLPLIVGITVVSFILTMTVGTSPNEEEIRSDLAARAQLRL